MIKQKIAMAMTLALLSSPMVLMSTSANAWHQGSNHYRHCHSCYHGSSNMNLVYRVVRELRASPATYNQRIYVTASGHKVMLSGFVGTAQQRQEAVNITRYTCGVRLVVDSLRLQAP